jgi:predicted nucleic acid-binding protein
MEIDSPVVFDAEPLLAYLDDEPGSSEIRHVIEDIREGRCEGFINYITLYEVTYVAERVLDESIARNFVETLLDYGIEPVDAEEVWYPAAKYKNKFDVSLGGAVVLATARRKRATALVGADGDFDSIPDELIERFRAEPA